MPLGLTKLSLLMVDRGMPLSHSPSARFETESTYGKSTSDCQSPQGGSKHQEDHQDDADDRDGEVSEVAEERGGDQAVHIESARAGCGIGGQCRERRPPAASPAQRGGADQSHRRSDRKSTRLNSSHAALK